MTLLYLIQENDLRQDIMMQCYIFQNISLTILQVKVYFIYNSKHLLAIKTIIYAL